LEEKEKEKRNQWDRKILERDSVFEREEKWKGLIHCYIEIEERKK